MGQWGLWVFPFKINLSEQVFRLGVTCIKSLTSQGGAGDSSAFWLHHEVELQVKRKLKTISIESAIESSLTQFEGHMTKIIFNYY